MSDRPTLAPVIAAELEAVFVELGDIPDPEYASERVTAAATAHVARALRDAGLDPDELVRLEKGATPGPWKADEYDSEELELYAEDNISGLYIYTDRGPDSPKLTDVDAKLIAAARTALGVLIATGLVGEGS